MSQRGHILSRCIVSYDIKVLVRGINVFTGFQKRIESVKNTFINGGKTMRESKLIREFVCYRTAFSC